jgi:hypothetical protein
MGTRLGKVTPVHVQLFERFASAEQIRPAILDKGFLEADLCSLLSSALSHTATSLGSR